MRRKVPMVILSAAGVWIIIDYLISYPVIQQVSLTLRNWSVIIAGFTLMLGAISTSILHGKKIISKEQGWGYSSILMLVLLSTLIIGIVLTPTHPAYEFLYFNAFFPMTTTTYSLLCFFIASAAYRAFRTRNVDATILLVSAILVMLRNAPIGQVIWSGFPAIGDWVMLVPNLAGKRGIIIGVALGSIYTGIRVLSGYEKGLTGGGGE